MRNVQASTREDWIANGLRSLLSSHGFDWLPHLHQFRSSNEDGFTCLILSVSGYPDTSIVEAHLGIRIDAVENIAFPFTNGMPGFKPESMTLVTPLGRLFGKRYERFEVESAEQADAVAATFRRQLTEEGFLFLGQYSQLDRMEYLFNENPQLPLSLIHNQVNRCFRGMVLAKLLSRPDFESLAGLYRRQMELLYAPEPTREKFERLYDFLRSYSLN